jgi:hypothetical protein
MKDMREANRICDWCQEIRFLLSCILKSTDAGYKTFYFGKLLLAHLEIKPSYCVLLLYMSFSLFPFIMKSQSISSSLQSGRGTLERYTEYPLIFCTGLV